jgi:hypothetical protein
MACWALEHNCGAHTVFLPLDIDFGVVHFALRTYNQPPKQRTGVRSTPEKALTAADFRRIALSLPEAVEGSHFGNADFRVGGKIFATLALEKEGYGVLLLTPEQQAGMVGDEPKVFSPVPGGWGRQGSTRVRLAKVPADILESALRTAWRRRAPKRLLGARPAR